MVEHFAGVVGGLGLFVVGMWFLTENLKKLASRRLRRTAQRLTGHPLSAFFWGGLAGGATQSMTGLAFIVVSILRSGMITTKSAFALILGGGGGVTLLVLVVTFDVRIVALFVLGLSGFCLTSKSLSKYRRAAAAFLGGAMIVFGLTLLKESAAPLADQPWFRDMMAGAGTSPLLAFLVATGLTAAVQSSSTVSVFGISLSAAGVLTIDQAIMVIYGTFIGSSAVMYILSANLTGRSRQVSMYLVYLNVVICAVMIPLFYAELYFDMPAVRALVLALPFELDQQLAIVYVIGSLTLLPVLLLLLDPTTRLFERLWPVSPIDELSKAHFIYDHASVDLDTSAMLVELEQKRVFGIFPQYFDVVRQGEDLAPVQNACRNVLGEIGHFLDDLHASSSLQGTESRNAMISRLKLLSWMESAVGAMCKVLLDLNDRPGLEKFRDGIREGVDAVFLAVNDAMESGDEISWTMATQLIGDRRAQMREMRARYMGLDSRLLQQELTNILLVTNAVEETFFLMAKLEAEFNPNSRPEAHVPHAR